MVVSELFYKIVYISKVSFFKYFIVYTLTSEIRTNVDFVKKKCLILSHALSVSYIVFQLNLLFLAKSTLNIANTVVQKWVN